MYAEEFPFCCALNVMTGVDYQLTAKDAYSKREAEKLNTYVTEAAVCVVTDQSKENYKQAAAFLKTKGWKLLGMSPGAHGAYHCYMWGSKEFKVPVRTARKK